jgi:Zn-dependent peptidase ImmA (M78 family)
VPEPALRAMPEAVALGTSPAMPEDRDIAAVAATFSVSKQVLWYRLRDVDLISRNRFAAKWPLWSQQKKPPKPKLKGGPPAPVRVLAGRGLRFTSLVLQASNERLLTTNEALDYLGIRLGDLEDVEREFRRRASA